jgi:DNA-directed RNA polymerase beta subunit
MMAYKFKKFGSYRERADFSKVGNSLELQDLLEIQKKSYEWFRTEGIKEVLEDLFPIESFSGNLSLDFGDYVFETCVSLTSVTIPENVNLIGQSTFANDI